MVTTATPPERNADVRLDLGLAALESGEYRAAFRELSWVYSQCAGHERSIHALVGLAALELDVRNEAGRPGTGAELLGRLLTEPGPPEWMRPLTETSYLMALALGASSAGPDPARADTAGPDTTAGDTTAGDSLPARSAGLAPARDANAEPRGRAVQEAGARIVQDEPVYNCGAPVPTESVGFTALPALPGPSLLSLLAEAEAERDASASRAEALNAELRTLRQRLQETEQELERIRRTLRP